MFSAPKKAALRRMRLEELISKIEQIEQIEQQASLTLDEYPHGRAVERLLLIAAIARQVRFHLADQIQAGDRQPLPSDPTGEVPLVQI